MGIVYKESVEISYDEIYNLYQNLNWTSYTNDMPRLVSAINHSLTVVSAWDEEKLVGLIRVVGDGLTIIYIQDILVLEAYQNKGIGSELMSRILTKYGDVRQKVLLTEDSIAVRSFYEKHRFESCDKGKLVAFAKLL
ncbi:GNAT family N-acetyltransferase [Anaerobacillus sp. CMMVII]|uniref:GNAT family N-acetyltransferase n=1 Tax=Anaerobacillus sp. CMMVII TaxID=2755588 RepID=UPI0021B7227C|nr:GNAT family N-acetyltransferase [Anaerobacillus sp. CMMVII]MCT8137305.1 GNAT family N-acetyltransferase [Anaerobacillus sp. CMMVII]